MTSQPPRHLNQWRAAAWRSSISSTWNLPAALLLGALLAPAVTLAQQSPKAMLVVVNQADADISLVDPLKATQVARVAEGAVTGHEVAISLDGRTAYVPIYGDSVLGKAGSNGREILAIDLASRKIVHRLDLGHEARPHCAVMSSHDNLLYVTTELDHSVTIVDPTTFTVVGTIPTGEAESHMLVLSHNGRFGYTANVASGTVSVLDLKARKLLRVIHVAGEVQRISISEDDRMVFTADQKNPRMAVIDTATNKVKAWIPLPSLGYGSVAIPGSQTLLITLPDTSQIAVVDLQTYKVRHVVAVPSTPVSVLVDPGGRSAYAACMDAGEVAVLDLSTWSVKTEIKVGKGSGGMGWAGLP